MILAGTLTSPLLELPIHTQAVERHVKLVTDVSKRYVKVDDRDGSIRATKKSRELIPAFKSKKDYKPGLDVH